MKLRIFVYSVWTVIVVVAMVWLAVANMNVSVCVDDIAYGNEYCALYGLELGSLSEEDATIVCVGQSTELVVVWAQ